MPKPNTRPPARARKPGKAGAKARPGAVRKAKSGGSADDGQIGALMSKGLDLAEASLTLGLNFVQRLGTTMQEQVIGKITQAGQSFMQAAATPPAQPAGDGDEGAAPRQPSAAGASFAGVTNRQPLFPGSPLRVSFSINNESANAAKKVAVKLGDLVGEITRATLPAAGLAVEPASATIAPMDFEKFVLTGVVPMNAKSDAYQGWIVVTGEEQLRIPLRLVVTGRT